MIEREIRVTTTEGHELSIAREKGRVLLTINDAPGGQFIVTQSRGLVTIMSLLYEAGAEVWGPEELARVYEEREG